jgi:hypothetical protein
VTVKVSQAGAEALWRVNPGAVASQAGAEFLHKVLPSFSVSQVGRRGSVQGKPVRHAMGANLDNHAHR